MGWLDGLMNLATGGAQSPGGSLVQAALQLVQQHGGLPGLIDKLNQAGLAGHTGSWVSTGQNLPISADQLQQALGSGALTQIAQQFGINTSDIARVLPQVIDHMTPQGQIPGDHGAMLAQAISALTRGG